MGPGGEPEELGGAPAKLDRLLEERGVGLDGTGVELESELSAEVSSAGVLEERHDVGVGHRHLVCPFDLAELEPGDVVIGEAIEILG